MDFKFDIRYFIIIIVLLIINVTTMQAQFEGQFSQYMYTKTFINPASVGEQEMTKALIAERLQWIGIKNAPKTTYFAISTPFIIGKTRNGGGIQFITDSYGIFKNQKINLQYAYQYPLSNGIVSFGIDLGFINIISYGDSIHLVESDYHTSNDPALPTGEESGIGFDLGAGVFYKAQKMHLGLALSHITKPAIILGNNTSFNINPVIKLNGDYTFDLNIKDIQIEPSILFISDFNSWQSYLNIIANFNNKYWGGIGYSYQNAISFMVGIYIMDGLKIGYDYDLPTSQLLKATSGSHEMFASYDFSLLLKKEKHKHKSIRIL